MNFYEHVFIVRPEVSSQRAQALAEEFGATLTKGGGSVGKTEYWGLKDLAYPIKKNDKGHYLLMNITANPSDVGEMERQMKLHEDILRFLTLRVDELDENPSIQMKRKDKESSESEDSPKGEYKADSAPPVEEEPPLEQAPEPKQEEGKSDA